MILVNLYLPTQKNMFVSHGCDIFQLDLTIGYFWT
jgi:hypothetical protein